MTQATDNTLRRYLVWFPERHFELEPGASALLGRQADCDIVIPAPNVSRRHAQISWSRDGFEIRDLGSTNGTILNGDKISRRVLVNEDEFRIGSRVFTFLITAGAERDRFFARTRELRQSHATLAFDVDEMTDRAQGFAGNLADIGVPELSQVMQLSRKTGLIRLYIGDDEGRIWLNNGEILSVSFVDLHGEEAFYRLFTQKEGFFEFRPLDLVDREPDVFTKTQTLLMEGFRRQELSLEKAAEPHKGARLLTRTPSVLERDTVEVRALPQDGPEPAAAKPDESENEDENAEQAAASSLAATSEPAAQPPRRRTRRPTTIDPERAAIAAYVQIVFEQIVAPLLHERQDQFARFIIKNKVQADRIVIHVEAGARDEADHWLALQVEKQWVSIAGSEIDEEVIEGRPEPFELTRPFRRSLDSFLKTISGAAS